MSRDDGIEAIELDISPSFHIHVLMRLQYLLQNTENSYVESFGGPDEAALPQLVASLTCDFVVEDPLDVFEVVGDACSTKDCRIASAESSPASIPDPSEPSINQLRSRAPWQACATAAPIRNNKAGAIESGS